MGGLYNINMQNFLFNCSKCGAANRMGDSACRNCGLPFQYSCPACRQAVKGGDPVCKRCGNQLVWSAAAPVATKPKTTAPASQIKAGSPAEKRHNPWIGPLIGTILILVLVVGAALVLQRLNEKPASPAAINQTVQPPQQEYLTPDTHPPRIMNITVRNLNENSVEISWTTDEEATTQIMWHIRDGSTNISKRKDALVLQHQETLIDLKMNSAYYFKVISADRLNNEATSDEQYFVIGKEPGATRVEVQMHSMTIEEQPSGTRTLIRGVIINTGDYPVRNRDLQVFITINVPGKMGANEIQAQLDPSPEVLNSGNTCKFVAVVPPGTSPIYTIAVKVANP